MEFKILLSKILKQMLSKKAFNLETNDGSFQEGVLFKKDKTQLIVFSNGKGNHYIIPDRFSNV